MRNYQKQVEFSKKMKNAKVVGIPNFGHNVIDEKNLTLPHVLEFIEDVEKNRSSE